MKKMDKLKDKIEKHIQELGGPGSGRRPGDGAGSGDASGSGGSSINISTQSGDDIAAKSIGKSSSSEKGNGSSKRPEVEISGGHKDKLLDKINNNDPNDKSVSWKDGSPQYISVKKGDKTTVYKTDPKGKVKYEVGILKSGGGKSSWTTTNDDNGVERDVKNLFN